MAERANAAAWPAEPAVRSTNDFFHSGPINRRLVEVVSLLCTHPRALVLFWGHHGQNKKNRN